MTATSSISSSTSEGPLLEVRGVTKRFGGVVALDGCSLGVRRGTVTGLIGPNGAGKTTLFDVASGFVRPDAGEVRLGGRRVDGLAPHRIFDLGLMRTFQISRELVGMSVLENLLLVPGGQRGESLAAALLAPGRVRREEAGIRARAMEVLAAVGLDALAGEPAGSLSTGQKKILELARALMAEPGIVLLDEPGAGVNPVLMRALVGLIRDLHARGRTFLLIEHDMDLVMSLCDPVIVLDLGRRLAEGPADQVRRDPRVLEAYLGGAP